MLHTIESQDEFDSLITQGGEFIIFKHSMRCFISDHGCKEVYAAIEALDLDNVYIVNVLMQRDVSKYIATFTGIKHESPQLIFFKNGKAYAHGSHGQVNERNIRHILGGGWAGNKPGL